MKTALMTICLILMPVGVMASDWKPNCPDEYWLADQHVACSTDRLSYVMVSFEENISYLKGNEDYYIELSRTLVKKYIPILKHEDLMSIPGYQAILLDKNSIDAKRRAMLTVNVRTVSSDTGYPVAFLVSAELSALGDMVVKILDESVLGYTDRQGLANSVEKSLDACIRSIAKKYYRAITEAEMSMKK